MPKKILKQIFWYERQKGLSVIIGAITRYSFMHGIKHVSDTQVQKNYDRVV